LHHRLSHEIAQLEVDFVEMGVSTFVDTQTFEEVDRQDLLAPPI
jgi:hypothetical protein